MVILIFDFYGTKYPKTIAVEQNKENNIKEEKKNITNYQPLEITTLTNFIVKESLASPIKKSIDISIMNGKKLETMDRG